MEQGIQTAEAWYQQKRAPLLLAFFCSLWVVFIGGAGSRMPLLNLPAGPAADDVIIHSQYIASAAESQGESLLIREAPRMQWAAVGRYPFYQFYSFLPYYLAALFVQLGFGPYVALVLMFFLSFVVSGWAAYGLARAMGQSREAGLIACAAFIVAPYHISDLFGRFAYPEVICFAIIPLVFWSSLAVSERSSLGNFLFNAASWAAMILSHNIFHAWTMPLLILWMAWMKFIAPRPAMRILPPALGYLFGLAMALFFFAVPLQLGSQVAINNIFEETLKQGLTPAWVLFYPFWGQIYATKGSPDLGLQVGWPFLVAFLAAFKAQTWRVVKNAAWILFPLMIFGAWSPVNFWPYLGPLRVIAFPYRLLAYSTLFGTIMIGEWVDTLPTWQLRKWLPWLLLLLLALALPWKRNGGLAQKGSDLYQGWKATGPRMAAGTPDYAISFGWLDTTYKADNFFQKAGAATVKRTGGANKLEWLSAVSGSVQVLDFKASAWTKIQVNSDEKNAFMVLPAFWYPKMYQVKIDGKPVPYGFVGQNLAVELQEGKHEVAYHFSGDRRANWVSVFAWLIFLGLAWRWYQGRKMLSAASLAAVPPDLAAPKRRQPTAKARKR